MKKVILIIVILLLTFGATANAQSYNASSRWIQGNLIFFDPQNYGNWLFGIGNNVVQMDEDWIGGSSIWDEATLIDSILTGWRGTDGADSIWASAFQYDDSVGGVLKMGVTDRDDDTALLRLGGMPFHTDTAGQTTERPISYYTRLDFPEVRQFEFTFGLANDFDMIPTDGIFFRSVDGSDTIWAVQALNSKSDSVMAKADFDSITFYEFGFNTDGNGNTTFFVDGVDVGTLTGTIPFDEDLAPFVYIKQGEYKGGMTRYYTHIDRIRVIQIK